MTEISAPLTIVEGTLDSPEAPAQAVNRLVVLTRTVLSSTGARAGLVWVSLMAFCAFFAPLLANSSPILLKADGQWSSPLLKTLTPADVVLQALFWTAAVLLVLRRFDGFTRLCIWIGVLVISIPISIVLIQPPRLMTYEAYRQLAAQGRVQFVLHTPIAYSPDDHLRDQQDVRLQPPDGHHWMGTTSDSADLASNMIFATRIALSIGFISTGIAVSLGIIIGGLMGYFGGLVDLLGMRLVEIFDAIPTLLLLLCFVAVFPPNLYIMMAIIGLTSWVGYAVFVRAEFLSLRDRDFVHAARAAGLPLRSILFRHMLPNGITPVIVSASFGVASAILAESTLSFLGIGLSNEASWGGLLSQALGEGGSFYWWIASYPGLAIFATVFAYNLIGESLRDALDPKLRNR
jgi:peptide/nickel transport system permease protein